MRHLLLILILVACTNLSLSADTNAPSQHAWSQFPITGMTAADLKSFVNEISSQIPVDERIIELRIQNENEVTVRMGEIQRPRTGGGRQITFKKIDGRWVKSGSGGWMM